MQSIGRSALISLRSWHLGKFATQLSRTHKTRLLFLRTSRLIQYHKKRKKYNFFSLCNLQAVRGYIADLEHKLFYNCEIALTSYICFPIRLVVVVAHIYPPVTGQRQALNI